MIYVTRNARQTVFFSSHLLSDVERVADRIAVLDHGILRANCSLETFRRQVRQVALSFPGLPPPVPHIPGLLQSLRSEGELLLTLVNPDDDTERALDSLGALRRTDVPMGLEDAFISYLGERGEKSFFLNNVEAQP
jgi:ABC-2 type transport system ATP-binding protein